MSEKQSIWKKEIRFGRKAKDASGAEAKPPKEKKRKKSKGVAVPTPAPQPERPESVADLLRPGTSTQVPEPVSAAPPAAVVPAEPDPPPFQPPTAPPVFSLPTAARSEAPPAPQAIPRPMAALSRPDGPPVSSVSGFDGAEDAPGAEATDGGSAGPDAKAPKLPRKDRKRVAKETKATNKRQEQARKAAEKRRKNRERGVKRHKRVVGLDIGATHMSAAQVVNNGQTKLVKIARGPLERGVVVGGELREPDALAEQLKQFFKENGLSKRGVRLGLGNARIGMRTFELVGIDDPKQLENAIRFRAQETLPIALDEAVLDHRILDERVDEEGQIVRKVLLVVAHREPAERFVAACRKAGLRLVGIDLEAFALLRALAGPPAAGTADDAGFVVVSIGYERTIVAVSNGEVCDYTRVLEWGGGALDVVIARALDLTPAEAEPLRVGLSLREEGETDSLDAVQADRARQAARGELQAFARDLVAALRFYQEQPESLGIAEIVLTGGTAQFEGLAEELAGLIGVAVRVGDPLARVKSPRKLRKKLSEPNSLSSAIGLAIEV